MGFPENVSAHASSAALPCLVDWLRRCPFRVHVSHSSILVFNFYAKWCLSLSFIGHMFDKPSLQQPTFFAKTMQEPGRLERMESGGPNSAAWWWRSRARAKAGLTWRDCCLTSGSCRSPFLVQIKSDKYNFLRAVLAPAHQIDASNPKNQQRFPPRPLSEELWEFFNATRWGVEKRNWKIQVAAHQKRHAIRKGYARGPQSSRLLPLRLGQVVLPDQKLRWMFWIVEGKVLLF